MGWQSMPRGKREQADQVIHKPREAELELSRGKNAIKRLLFCRCRDEQAVHLASMFR